MKYKIRLNGRVYEVEAEQGEAQLLCEYDDVGVITAPAKAAPVAVTAPAAVPAAEVCITGGKTINAPLPGTVTEIKIKIGQKIEKGNIVAVIESMKMENEIVATESGVVTAVHAVKGAQVQSGEPIVSLS